MTPEPKLLPPADPLDALRALWTEQIKPFTWLRYRHRYTDEWPPECPCEIHQTTRTIETDGTITTQLVGTFSADCPHHGWLTSHAAAR